MFPVRKEREKSSQICAQIRGSDTLNLLYRKGASFFCCHLRETKRINQWLLELNVHITKSEIPPKFEVMPSPELFPVTLAPFHGRHRAAVYTS